MEQPNINTATGRLEQGVRGLCLCRRQDQEETPHTEQVGLGEVPGTGPS